MADSRCWSREVLTNFIELYRELPCLWKIKSKEYLNKNLKNEAYDKLVEFCKPIFPSANRDIVYKKVQSLRGAFRKEFKKVSDSVRSGKGTDDVYTPTLWYYDFLMFTMDQQKPNQSISNLDIEDEGEEMEDDAPPEEENAEAQNREESELVEHETRTFTTPEIPLRPTAIAPNKTAKKRKRDNIEMETFMRTCTNALQRPFHSKIDITEFEATGIKVGKQLERMEPRQAIYADSLITEVLKRGLLGTLQPETSLYDSQSIITQYNSPATHSSNFCSNQSSMGSDHEPSNVRTYFTSFGDNTTFDDPKL